MKLIMPESPAEDGLRLIRLSHEMNVCGYLSSSGASLQEVEHVRAYMYLDVHVVYLRIRRS